MVENSSVSSLSLNWTDRHEKVEEIFKCKEENNNRKTHNKKNVNKLKWKIIKEFLRPCENQIGIEVEGGRKFVYWKCFVRYIDFKIIYAVHKSGNVN